MRRSLVEIGFTYEAADQLIKGDGGIDSDVTTNHRLSQPLDVALGKTRKAETGQWPLHKRYCRREQRR
jgi:hypothetical protein